MQFKFEGNHVKIAAIVQFKFEGNNVKIAIWISGVPHLSHKDVIRRLGGEVTLLCLRSTRALYLPTVAMLPRCLYTKGSPRSISAAVFAYPPPALLTLFSKLARYFPCRSATCFHHINCKYHNCNKN